MRAASASHSPSEVPTARQKGATIVCVDLPFASVRVLVTRLTVLQFTQW
jgi:hypothetical protein